MSKRSQLSFQPASNMLALFSNIMKGIKPLDFLVYCICILSLGSLILAFIDPGFRPLFAEIVKTLISSFAQGLVSKM